MEGTWKLALATALAAAALGSAGAAAQAPQAAPALKIGYVTTLSGPGSLYGEEIQRGFRLAFEGLGGKFGGLPVELVVADDQAKPQTASQVVRQMMERDGVRLITGPTFSHVVEAITASALPTGRIVVAPVGGSSQLAGEGCQRNFFTASWNTDTMFEVIGEHLRRNNVKRVAVIASNFQAGWDTVSGLKRGFEGELAAEILVRLDQSDFSAELTQLRQARPEAVVYFLPGGPGNAFLRQFNQAGLARSIKSYAATFQADEMTFSALGEAAVGLTTVGVWSPGLDSPANKRFVEAFRARHGRGPGILAAIGYDTALMLDAAVREVGGRLDDADALRAALRKAEFGSVRGTLSFGPNNFPIQNFYLNRVGRGPSGPQTELVETVAERRADVHAPRCRAS